MRCTRKLAKTSLFFGDKDSTILICPFEANSYFRVAVIFASCDWRTDRSGAPQEINAPKAWCKVSGY